MTRVLALALLSVLLCANTPAKAETYEDLTQAEFQAIFNEMVSAQQYPNLIEGRCYDGNLFLKVNFLPYPYQGFGFFAIAGASDEQLYARDNRASSAGMHNTYHQWVTCAGRTYNQALWWK